jgi:hypothetical protein
MAKHAACPKKSHTEMMKADSSIGCGEILLIFDKCQGLAPFQHDADANNRDGDITSCFEQPSKINNGKTEGSWTTTSSSSLSLETDEIRRKQDIHTLHQ